MPELLDWQRLADPHDAVRRAVESLGAGRLVVLPTESGYHLALRGDLAEAIARWQSVAPSDPFVVAVRDVNDALEWSPRLSPIGRRLARRAWPGPVVFELAADETGPWGRLPESVRPLVVHSGFARLQAPRHDVVQAVLEQLDAPLLLAPPAAATVAELINAAGEHIDLAFDDGPPASPAATVVRVEDGGWLITRAGAVSEQSLQRWTLCLVIFVCTGNTCRSPLAEALFKKRLAERLECPVADLPERGFLVLSAGLAAMMGGSAADEAVATARAYEADLAEHRSRPLLPELAAQADFLVGMTRDHIEAIAHYYPRLGVEPRLLHPAGEDIADPVGQAREVYRACGEQIWECLPGLLDAVAQAGPHPPKSNESEGASA